MRTHMIKSHILMFNGIQIEASPYVSDHFTVQRTWRERLFSRPWQPNVKTRSVYRPRAYCFEGHCIVSYQSYSLLLQGKPSVELEKALIPHVRYLKLMEDQS